MSAFTVELRPANPHSDGAAIRFTDPMAGIQSGYSFFLSRSELVTLAGALMAYLFESAGPGTEFEPARLSDPRDPRPGDEFPNVGYVRHITGKDPVTV